MGRKKTHEQFLLEMQKLHPNIEILSQYETSQSRIRCKCKIDGYEWEPTGKKLSEGRGCPKCAGTLKLNNEEFIQRLYNISPNIEILSPYINARTKVSCKCRVCSREWEAKPNSLLVGKTGCPKCANIKKSLSLEEFNSILKEVNPEITVLKYVSANKKGTFRCLKCGNIWEARPSHIIRDFQGCPACSSSKGERQIKNFLEGGKIEYIPQFQIDASQFTQTRVRVDFYLPKFNVIIEYNGKQHYEPVDFGDKDPQKALDKFNKQVLRDNELKEYCKNNNIHLIEIPYTVKIQDINDFLQDKLWEIQQ